MAIVGERQRNMASDVPPDGRLNAALPPRQGRVRLEKEWSSPSPP